MTFSLLDRNSICGQLVSLIYASQAAYPLIRSSEAKGIFFVGSAVPDRKRSAYQDAKISIPLFGESTV